MLNYFTEDFIKTRIYSQTYRETNEQAGKLCGKQNGRQTNSCKKKLTYILTSLWYRDEKFLNSSVLSLNKASVKFSLNLIVKGSSTAKSLNATQKHT